MTDINMPIDAETAIGAIRIDKVIAVHRDADLD